MSPWNAIDILKIAGKWMMGHHVSHIYLYFNLTSNSLLLGFINCQLAEFINLIVNMRLILSHLFHVTMPVSLIAIARKASCNVLARFSSCDQDDDMSKIGINGFGRIGRLVLRASLERGGQVRWKESCDPQVDRVTLALLIRILCQPGRRHQWPLHRSRLHGLHVQVWLHPR